MLLYHEGGLPLYRQLYEELKTKIIGGTWLVDTMIPAESALMIEYGVGRETTRRALLQLVNEGYLYRRRGVGTVVCRNRPEDSLESLVSFSAEMIRRGVKPGAVLLELDKRVPPQAVADALGTKQGEKVVFFRRLRQADQLAVAVEDSYLAPSLVGDVNPEHLAGSVYEYLVHEQKIVLGRVMVEISSVSADKELAMYLNIEKGQPLLRMTRTIHTAEDQPFFHLVFNFRGDLYSIKSSLNTG